MSQKQSLITKDTYKLYANQTVGVHGQNSIWIRVFTTIMYVAVVLVSEILGGNTKNGNKQTADRFHLWVNPPGYFFAIWGVIYTGVAISVIYNLIKNVWNLKAHLFFTMINICSIAWTIVFDLDTAEAVGIASIILLLLTYFVFLTWIQIGRIPADKINFGTYFMRNVFAFYLGWCIAATNINFGMDVVYLWGGSKKQQMLLFWILTPLCAILAFAFNVVKYGKYGIKSCLFVWVSVFWAFAGAAISTYECVNGLQDLC